MEKAKEEKKETVKITLEQVSSSDNLITGEICISNTQEMTCSQVDLKAKVLEKVEWEDYSQAGKKTIKSSKTHYDTTYTIYKFENKILPVGTLVLPFSIPQPDFPNGTIEFISGSHKGHSKCTLKGILIGEKTLSAKAHCHFQIQIDPPPIKEVAEEINVKLSIAAKGKSKMLAFMEKTSYVPNERATALFIVDNSGCRLNMREISIRLLQNVKLITTDGKPRLLEKIVCEQKILGVPMGKILKEPQKLSLVIPKGICPSIETLLISCSYFIKVTGAFEGPAANSMNIILPIIIYPEAISNAKKEYDKPSVISPLIKLPALQKPGTIKANPLALMVIPNSCKQVALYY
eukprot:TRINITY_DN570_c0_g1_i1.p1 TRINITY_DN570_c0_g1~~TRINITY_DN570_c0_g1_i1.p1  ORF type:complete len:348 (-),score=69.59 TRINITY_DN570_c0_g1_i1:12-1055(-)